MYQPEKWMPKPNPVEVFLISLENIQDIQTLLGATSVRQAYNRNRTILIEWTMMHRETFSGLVGQYIVRNDRGEFEVLDADELRQDYVPFIEEAKSTEVVFNHPELGRLLAVRKDDEGGPEAIVFELPSGNAETFVLEADILEGFDPNANDVAVLDTDPERPGREEQQERKAPVPGPPKSKNHNKENN